MTVFQLPFKRLWRHERGSVQVWVKKKFLLMCMLLYCQLLWIKNLIVDHKVVVVRLEMKRTPYHVMVDNVELW